MNKNIQAPFKKNDIIELEITSTGSRGEGIGHFGGMAVFVPSAAEEDVLRVKIVKVDKRMAYGRVEEIIKPSPYRVEPMCPAFPRCGGCSFRHISYEKECEIKLRRVADAFKHIGGIELSPDSIIAGEPERYRNKAQYPCASGANGKAVFGFYAEHSHRVIECADCLLQPVVFAGIIGAVSQYMHDFGITPYDEATGKGVLRHLYMRRSWATGKLMVCLVCTQKKLPGEEELCTRLRAVCAEIDSIVINVNAKDTNVILGDICRSIYGDGYITDTLLGISFRISPLSFFQVNRNQAERLYATAAEFADLTGSETLIDMYCGAGTIGLTMAHSAKKLIGVEMVAPAIEDAKENAQMNGITNAEFICADAAKAAEMLHGRGEHPEVVILDPPRKGCSVELLGTIAGMHPQRIVYVSCDPATQARDISILQNNGYNAVKARAVNMFPRTSHVETVVLMSRTTE